MGIIRDAEACLRIESWCRAIGWPCEQKRWYREQEFISYEVQLPHFSVMHVEYDHISKDLVIAVLGQRTFAHWKPRDSGYTRHLNNALGKAQPAVLKHVGLACRFVRRLEEITAPMFQEAAMALLEELQALDPARTNDTDREPVPVIVQAGK